MLDTMARALRVLPVGAGCCVMGTPLINANTNRNEAHGVGGTPI